MNKSKLTITRENPYHSSMKLILASLMLCVTFISLSPVFLFAQDFKPALVSKNLPSPLIHTKPEIRQFLAKLEALSPGEPYAETPLAKPPFRAGSLKSQFISHGLQALNTVRFLAGLSTNVVADPEWNTIAQYGAVLLTVRGKNVNHRPPYPENSGLPMDFYNKGYTGTSTSNLSESPGDLRTTLMDMMDDSDPINVFMVGHRRWLIDPDLHKIGFGMASKFTVVKVFVAGDPEKGEQLAYSAWPAAGNFPLGWFDAKQAWTFSINPEAFKGNLQGDVKKITIKMVRQRDGKIWNFSYDDPENWIFLEQSRAGLPYCLIFRPNQVGAYRDGDRFDVEIQGVSDGDGQIIPIHYATQFFNAGKDLPIIAKSQKPAQIVVHSSFTTQGIEGEFESKTTSSEGRWETIIGAGYPIGSFSWYVDGPDGIWPIGIEINNNGVIHGPGENIAAPAEGIFSIRLDYSEPVLSYLGYDMQHKGYKFTDWGRTGHTINFDNRAVFGEITIRITLDGLD